MKKRHFLGALAGGASLPLASLAQAAKASTSPALLTVTGNITKTNRGPFDAVLDQMMAKQKLAFDKAHAFDFAALAALPAVTIKPTLEYDKKQRALTGPLLATVLQACGATGSELAMRAIESATRRISPRTKSMRDATASRSGSTNPATPRSRCGFAPRLGR
jgi:hypothetical protein